MTEQKKMVIPSLYSETEPVKKGDDRSFYTNGEDYPRDWPYSIKPDIMDVNYVPGKGLEDIDERLVYANGYNGEDGYAERYTRTGRYDDTAFPYIWGPLADMARYRSGKASADDAMYNMYKKMHLGSDDPRIHGRNRTPEQVASEGDVERSGVRMDANRNDTGAEKVGRRLSKEQHEYTHNPAKKEWRKEYANRRKYADSSPTVKSIDFGHECNVWGNNLAENREFYEPITKTDDESWEKFDKMIAHLVDKWKKKGLSDEEIQDKKTEAYAREFSNRAH